MGTQLDLTGVDTSATIDIARHHRPQAPPRVDTSQLTMGDVIDDLPEDPLCDYCGSVVRKGSKFCGERCAQLARSEHDAKRLVEYEPIADGRMDDREDCAHYDVCLSYAIKADQPCVCTGCTTGFVRSTAERFTTIRSNAIMAVA